MSDRRETESPLITRCPYCETSFRVTEAHLKAANGAVRCGACLLVFPASQHMVDAHSRDEESTVSPSPDDIGMTISDADIEAADTLEEMGDDESIADENMADENMADEFVEMHEADEPGDAGSEWMPTGGEETDDPDLAPGFSQAIDVETDPDDIVGPVQEQRRRWTLAWLAGSIVLVGALGLQYAWMQKDALAGDLRYRSYYVTACAWLGCQVPDYRDVSALKIASLTVRSHAEVDQALVFNALLRNDAPFRQRFPPLDLEFTDMQSERVAARRFEPREYLGGEMAGLQYIPARTEVRVSLEVVDPGENALGYSLTVPETW